MPSTRTHTAGRLQKIADREAEIRRTSQLVRACAVEVMRRKTLRHRCSICSMVLAPLVEGVMCRGYAKTRNGWRSHAWVRTRDGYHVDITLTQFFRSAPEVYVGASTHDDVEYTEDCGEYSFFMSATKYMIADMRKLERMVGEQMIRAGMLQEAEATL